MVLAEAGGTQGFAGRMGVGGGLGFLGVKAQESQEKLVLCCPRDSMTFRGYLGKKLSGMAASCRLGRPALGMACAGGLCTAADTTPNNLGMGKTTVQRGKQCERQVAGVQLLEIIYFKAWRFFFF